MSKWMSKPSTAAAAAVGLAGSAAILWANTKPEGFYFDPSDLSEQSVAHPTIPACRMSKYSKEDILPDTASTLYDSFLSVAQERGDKPFLGKRSSLSTGFDTWLTYSQGLERITHIGYGLRWLKLKPLNSTFVGMFSKNRMEMLMTQIACYQHSMVIVPMYDTLGAEGIEHIVNQTQMEVVICDTEAKVLQLTKWGGAGLPHVTTVVYMDPVSEQTVQAAKSNNWNILSFSDMEMHGKSNPVEQVLCKPEDLCVVCYTSGTTGRPKGAMIQHNSLFGTALISMRMSHKPLGDGFITDDEAHLSYLPLAHMYEQIVIVEMIMMGAKIGFFSGEVTELLNDIRYLRPTYFPSVPRLLTKIYDTVMNSVNQSFIKRKLFDKALEEKEHYYRRGIITKSTVWDKILFKKLQDLLGGRIKMIVTGSAPISPPVLRFYRLAFGAVVFEGYGQTESSAGISFTIAGEYQTCEVGPPLPFNMIKLEDVPDMNYYAANNIGEICIKGLNVFRGYLYDEEKTNKAIDKDGWLHTGDVGMWTERGTLKIVDRKKNIFKLSQGEYIAPEKIENIYVNCPLVAQCFVHGDSLQSTVVAVVVPDGEVLQAFAQSALGLDTADLAELCRNEKVKTEVMAGMAKCSADFDLKGFEQVKDIYLTAEPFSVENHLLTPTYKLKRAACQQKYRGIIDEMYSRLNQSKSLIKASL